MSALFIAIAVGIAAYVIFMIAVPRAAPEAKDTNVRAALDRLYEENRNHEGQTADILREQLNEESPVVRMIFSLPLMDKLHEVGLQAGYQNNMKQLLLFMIITLAVCLLLTLGFDLGPFGILLSVVLAYFIPYRHCVKRISRRNQRFLNHFPDALDMIVRSVRSGFPFSTALQMLAENAEEPVRGEFRIVVDDIALGRTMSQALARLATRINEADIHFFVVVLSVQQETGGNLSEIVGNLSSVIRKRKQLRQKIKAMTSEGQATGWVLGALPVFIFVALYFVQPTYLDPFFHDPLGHIFFGTVIALMVICFFVVRQMIDIDI